jgi:hypothetical protein
MCPSVPVPEAELQYVDNLLRYRLVAIGEVTPTPAPRQEVSPEMTWTAMPCAYSIACQDQCP